MLRRIILIVALVLAWNVPLAAQPPCGNALPARLLPGFDATVLFTDGSPLNIRAEPFRTAAVLDRIPEGESFRVTGFGQCSPNDGIVWFPVLYSDVVGWVAESVGGEYLVAPLNVERLSALLPQDAVLAAQVDPGEYVLVNRELSELTSILAPLDAPFPVLESGVEAFVRGGSFFVYTADADLFLGVAAHRPSGESTFFRQPERPGNIVGYVPSPDGQRVAWLFDLTTVPPTFNGCDAEAGCVGRVYELVIGEADGSDATLSEFTVGDPFPYLQLQNWIGDDIVLEQHMWGVASGFYPVAGGGLVALDTATGKQAELTPLTDLDELLSPDGLRVARAENGALLVSVTDFATGDVVWSFPREQDIAGGLSFSPDGRYLTFGVFVWETQTTEVRAVDLQTGEVRVLIAFDDPAAPPLASVGGWLSDTIAAVPHDGVVSAFDLSTGGSVFIDLVYTALGDDGRPVQAFVGRVE